jgi:hypothetical protein
MIPCILLKSLTIRLNLLLTYLIILIYEKCHIYLAKLVGYCIIYIGPVWCAGYDSVRIGYETG